MTLRELLETLKAFGVKLALHDGDTITAEPPEMLTPAVRAALDEHRAALVALIRSGPSSTSSFDTLLAGLDGLKVQRSRVAPTRRGPRTSMRISVRPPPGQGPSGAPADPRRWDRWSGSIGSRAGAR